MNTSKNTQILTTLIDNTALADLAQNYPQFMNQLQILKTPQVELAAYRKAFQVAQAMSDGIYRAQGVPLLNHVVRTASILLRENQSHDCVMAGLLHASFAIERFTDSDRTSLIERRRNDLLETFGPAVEELVFEYAKMRWYNKPALDHHRRRLPGCSGFERELLAIRLANELEDHLDLAMSYTSAGRIQFRSVEYGAACVDLANGLELKFIAESLDQILICQDSVTFDNEICWSTNEGYRLTNKKWVAGRIEKIARFVKKGLRWIKRKLYLK